MREWECLNCGAKHDRDENAAINILVAGGQSETLNGRGGKRKTSVKVAAASVSGSYAKQNVNPPRSYGSVGIPMPLGRGGCQSAFYCYEVQPSGYAGKMPAPQEARCMRHKIFSIYLVHHFDKFRSSYGKVSYSQY
ncbi:transposase [Okeania sp. KiyG1]|uniref:transposase n=1 Tax=Okeania sp. KiyG1 TaxID=2720165 RepID=UPI001F435A09|nr:transposase [Okeania sp. KiyG1]